MSLISILLFATAVLVFLVGLVTFIGSSAKERKSSFWFLLAAIASTVWTVAIAVFLALPVEATEVAPRVILVIYVGAFLVSPTALGYVGWKYRIGRILTVISLLAGACLGVVILRHPELLYSGFTLVRTGNSVELVHNWFNFVYIGYFVLVMGSFCFMAYRSAMKATSKRMRMGLGIFAIGMLIEATCAGIFDLILPLYVRYDLIWVGPLVLSVVIVAFFYAALKYRIVSVMRGWLKVMSYVVILASGAVVYMVIFYLIFTALFKIPNPSTSVLVLNFLMIVIVLLLMPVINEIAASIRSMISVGQVDLAYVVKKLNRIATKNVNLKDLAAFLADHLHFAYIGFVINGRLYGSKALAVSAEELTKIAHLRAVPHGVWQEPTKQVQEILDNLGLKAVAELKNAKGKPFGQIIVGKPLGKTNFERRDLVQLEMIINLVAMVIDSEKHLRA